LEENAWGVAVKGALHFEDGAVATDEAVFVAIIENFFWQSRFVRLEFGLGGESEIERFLLVEDGKKPVFEFERAARGDAVLVGEHLLAAGADGFADAAGFEEAAVKGWQKDLCAAYVERIGHGDDAAHAALQKRGRDGGEGVFGFVIEHGRLAGVEDDGGHGVIVQESAEIGGGFRVGVAVSVFEDEAALAGAELMGSILAGVFTIGPVAVEMKDVIVAGMLVEMFAKLIEGGRAKDIDMGGEVLLLDGLPRARIRRGGRHCGSGGWRSG